MPILLPAAIRRRALVLNLAILPLLIVSTLLVAGCGSTKVYTPDKTLVHKGAIYNLSGVKTLSTRLEAVPASGDPVDLSGYDSKRFDALVKEQGEIAVRSLIVIDNDEVVYQQNVIGKGRDFVRMQDELSDVQKKLTKFMGDGKKTQLKL